jgi:hypothetical protein
MELIVSETKQIMGKKAIQTGGELIRKALFNRGNANIILATGASQLELVKKTIYSLIRGSLFITVCLYAMASCKEIKAEPTSQVNMPGVIDSIKQKAILEKTISLLTPDLTRMGRVSFLDETFRDWLKRTGELPPDFDRMPSIPFLPDPLVIDEGGKNIPITNMAQWKEKREWMKKQLEYYITGTYPPKPENLQAMVLSEKKEGETIVRMILLTFGPGNRAKLTVEMMIPSGKGPFPVFLTQWNHREWAQIAVRRGYVGCVYAGADDKDDTEEYSEIWANEYDFTRLMRRAFAAYRAIDYLYTLPYIDKDKIGLTGHSRNGKLSLMAAAFDERIAACIPSSGGTGAEVPWRYCTPKYDTEDLAMLTSGFPSWIHPRIRFFIGHENKLPVDQNMFMALIAPRGLMLSAALTESETNPWGIEQAYHATKKVYKYLGAENNLAIRERYGLHSVCARDIEDYIDFFDWVFKRSDHRPENKLFFNYSFDKWCGLSGEKINPKSYPEKNLNDLDIDAQNNKIISVAGFTSMRLNTPDKGTEGIKAYSHLHGLIPRLGFFVDNEARIPYDFHEVLECIAPRPILVIAPVMDNDAIHKDIEYCSEQARKIYSFYGVHDNIQIFSPDDYNRVSPEMRERTYEWLQDRLISFQH